MSQLSHALAMWCDRLYGAPVTWPALSTAPCVIHKLLVGAPPAAAILTRPGHSCSRAPWRAPSGGWGDVAQENGNKLFAVNNAFMVTLHQLLCFCVALSKMFIRIHQTDWYVQNDSFASDKWSVQTTIPKVLLKYNVFSPCWYSRILLAALAHLDQSEAHPYEQLATLQDCSTWGHAVTPTLELETRVHTKVHNYA